MHSENPASQGEGVEGHTHTGRRIHTSGVPQREATRDRPGRVTGIPLSTAVGAQDLEAVGHMCLKCAWWALVLSLRLNPARSHFSACLVGGQRAQGPAAVAAGPLPRSSHTKPSRLGLGTQGHSPFPRANVCLPDRWPGLVGCSSRPPASSLEPPTEVAGRALPRFSWA